MDKNLFFLGAVVLVALTLNGCASPCMKKPTVMEQKQCKWTRRQNRDVGLFVGAGVGGIVLLPFIAGHVFGKGDAPKWLAPAFGFTWAIGMFGAMDGSTWIGKYPHEPYAWEKKNNGR